jgi:nucleotide-binding universal stress UspA family protein
MREFSFKASLVAMYRKIIVGHDLHEGGDDALALGKELASASGAKLVVAGVFPFGALPRGFEPVWRDQEAELAARIRARADAAGAEAEAVPSSAPARGLQELAAEIGADLVVIGSSRRSHIGEILAGNVGVGLLHGSPCAVGLAPRDYRKHDGGLCTLAVGFDGSEESELALEHAIELGKAADATLKVVTVAEPPQIAYTGTGMVVGHAELQDAIDEQRRAQLREALAVVSEDITVEGTLISGEPASKLADAARSRGTVLILGSRGYGPLRRVVLGSVSAALMRSAPCPVIVHPRGARSEFGAADSLKAGTA